MEYNFNRLSNTHGIAVGITSRSESPLLDGVNGALFEPVLQAFDDLDVGRSTFGRDHDQKSYGSSIFRNSCLLSKRSLGAHHAGRERESSCSGIRDRTGQLQRIERGAQVSSHLRGKVEPSIYDHPRNARCFRTVGGQSDSKVAFEISIAAGNHTRDAPLLRQFVCRWNSSAGHRVATAAS